MLPEGAEEGLPILEDAVRLEEKDVGEEPLSLEGSKLGWLPVLEGRPMAPPLVLLLERLGVFCGLFTELLWGRAAPGRFAVLDGLGRLGLLS